ncbi:MAG: 16S rRNA (uracil(1498)-N(3))-methyltransferase [Alphaproteobacteria bacterium]|nr:16S rRNA (uracil(1498)-N(3))-methyltransferase [Alphaproteobacteria bacterium]
MSKKNRIRIYVETDLKENTEVVCDEKQAHYLLNVMRLKIGDEVYAFDGKNGEFCCHIANVGKKNCVLKVAQKFCDFFESPDLWLLFAILKKDNTDFVVEKATEIGVKKIVPVITDYTSNSKPRDERLKTLVVEASEQSRRQDLPQVEECMTLKELLRMWDKSRKLIYLDESLSSQSAIVQMPKCESPAAILVGPEGGFSQKELEILRSLDYSYGVSLGKTILRAETAAVAALSLWQALAGHWQ